MKAWRIALVSIGVLMLALNVAARADQYGSDSAPIHITWQMQPTQSPKSSVPSVKEYYQSQIAAWVTAHPDVMLDVTFNSTDINASMTRMQEQATAGRTPDFAMLELVFPQPLLSVPPAARSLLWTRPGERLRCLRPQRHAGTGR